MTTDQIRLKLYSVAGYHDRLNEPEAIKVVLKAIDAAIAEVKQGQPIRQALLKRFQGKLLDHFLKSIKEPMLTKAERATQR